MRTKNDLVQWIKFFLVAVVETSKQGIDTFKEILRLRAEIEDKKIITLGKKLPLAKELILYLYKKPVITTMDLQEDLKISAPTANGIIKDFEKLKILSEKTGYKRNRIFLFEEYLNLFKR